MNNWTGTSSNRETSLSMDDLTKAMELINHVPTPNFDTLVSHPAHKLKDVPELQQFKVFENPLLLERIYSFKPRSKKKRIQKKAKKLYSKEVPSNKILLIDTRELFKNLWNIPFPNPIKEPNHE